MAASLGVCLLPSIGLSQIRSRSNVMGVDQRGSRLYYILRTPTTGIQSQCDFEHLPYLMNEYKIDQCVIDRETNSLEAASFARRFPERVTLGCWTHPTVVDDLHEVVPTKIYVPGKLFLHRGSHGVCDMAFVVKKAWGQSSRKNRWDETIMHLRIAQFIQMAT